MKIYPLLMAALIIALAIAIISGFKTQTKTEFSESEIRLSRYFDLTPVEIRQWQRARNREELGGFVKQENLSVYEILALQTEDGEKLHRLARLFANHNLQVIERLKKFDEIYQTEMQQVLKQKESDG